MSARCHTCGAETPLAKPSNGPWWQYRLTKNPVCQKCETDFRTQLQALNCFSLFVSLPLFIEALLIYIDNPVWWLIINFYLGAWFFEFCVPLHELGHALAAKCAGWGVQRIVLGRGRKIVEFRFLGFRWELRKWFGGGAAIIDFANKPFKTIPYAGLVAAGPAVNLGLALLTAWFAEKHAPWQLEPFTHGWQPFAAFFWANVSLATWSLFPRMTNHALGRIPSDGLQLWMLRKQSYIPSLLNQAQIAQKTGNTSQALPLATKAQADAAENKRIDSLRGVALLQKGDVENAKIAFTAYCERYDLTETERAMGCSNLAYAYAVMDDPATLPEADRLSKLAFTVWPGNFLIVGIRGSVKVAIGDFAEGEALLNIAQAKDRSPTNQAEYLCWFALSAAKQGRMDDARKHLETARTHDPKCFLIPRMEKTIQRLSEPTSDGKS